MFVGSRERPVSKADNQAVDYIDNVGSLSSCNSIGVYSLLRG
jgi:hypothetical protein